MKILLTIVALLAFFAPISGCLLAAETAAEIPVLAASDEKALADALGKTITVEGTVLGVGKGPKDGIRFLDFSTTKDQGFVGAVFPVAFSALGPLDGYVGKTVRITGELGKYQAQTQIKILKPAQIQILP